MEGFLAYSKLRMRLIRMCELIRVKLAQEMSTTYKANLDTSIILYDIDETIY